LEEAGMIIFQRKSTKNYGCAGELMEIEDGGLPLTITVQLKKMILP
jgi:hypothetical protein